MVRQLNVPEILLTPWTRPATGLLTGNSGGPIWPAPPCRRPRTAPGPVVVRGPRRVAGPVVVAPEFAVVAGPAPAPTIGIHSPWAGWRPGW